MISPFDSLGEQEKQKPHKQPAQPKKRRTIKERLSSLFQKPSNQKITKTPSFLEEVFPSEITRSVPLTMNLTQLMIDQVPKVFSSPPGSVISVEGSIKSFPTTRSSSMSFSYACPEVAAESLLWAFVLVVFGLRLYWGRKEDCSRNHSRSHNSSKLQEAKEEDDEAVPDLKCLLVEGECSETDSPLSSPKRNRNRKGIPMQTTKEKYIFHIEENVDEMALQKPSPSLIHLSQLLRRIFDLPKKAFLCGDGLGLKNRNINEEGQQQGTTSTSSSFSPPFHLEPREVRRRAASLLYSTMDTNTATRPSVSSFSMTSTIIPENQFYPAMLSAPLLSAAVVSPTSTSTSRKASSPVPSQTTNI